MNGAEIGRLEPYVREYYQTQLREKRALPVTIEPTLGHPPGPGFLIFGILFLVLGPFGVGMIIYHFVRASRYRAREASVVRAATQGKLRQLDPSQINNEFLSGKTDGSVGRFLGLADDGPPLDPSTHEDVLTLASFADEKDAEFGRLFRDDSFKPFRRHMVTCSLAPGRLLAGFDMILFGERLKGDRKTREYFAMIDPGSKAQAAFMVPDVVLEWARLRASGRNAALPDDPLLPGLQV